jgi:hypothetical protein
VELGKRSDDVGRTAGPKQPIPRLSKFVIGKNRNNMTDKRDRKKEERETERESHSCSDIGINQKKSKSEFTSDILDSVNIGKPSD